MKKNAMYVGKVTVIATKGPQCVRAVKITEKHVERETQTHRRLAKGQGGEVPETILDGWGSPGLRKGVVVCLVVSLW
jgi:hypothetical protein